MGSTRFDVSVCVRVWVLLGLTSVFVLGLGSTRFDVSVRVWVLLGLTSVFVLGLGSTRFDVSVCVRVWVLLGLTSVFVLGLGSTRFDVSVRVWVLLGLTSVFGFYSVCDGSGSVSLSELKLSLSDELETSSPSSRRCK